MPTLSPQTKTLLVIGACILVIVLAFALPSRSPAYNYVRGGVVIGSLYLFMDRRRRV